MSIIKILIISNNELSTTDANGKTLLSIFENDVFDIKQIYIKKTFKPTSKLSGSLYIDEKDIIKSVLKIVDLKTSQTNSIDNFGLMKKSVFKQCLREFIWLYSKKQYSLIDAWIKNNEFDVVFFMMGDSIFMCNIVLYILKKFNFPLLTYITDVYINELNIRSPLEYFFKKLLRKKQAEIIEKSSKLYTISDKMRMFYKEFCHVDSNILRNIAVTDIIKNDNKAHNFVYAGNLYYGRDEVLVLLAKVIKLINKQNNTDIYLKIYSNSLLTDVIKNEMKTNNYIFWGGQLSKEELQIEISKNTYILFVESFKEKYIRKVKYSFSTKITELALQGKCIVAIAPENIGSMDDLKSFAFCINDLNKLELKIRSLLKCDYNLYEEKAINFAKKNYSVENQFTKLRNDIVDLISNKGD